MRITVRKKITLNAYSILLLVILQMSGMEPLAGATYYSTKDSTRQRYLSFQIWTGAAADDLDFFKLKVDTAREKGFDTIILNFPWSTIESSENQFNFAWLDERVDYTAIQGLKVVLGIVYTAYPDWIDEYYLMKEENGETYNSPLWGPGGIPIIADIQVRQWMERLLVKTVEQYQNRYTSNTIVYYSLRFSPAQESEYAFDSFLDYSPQAQLDFQQWLEDKYLTINSLNERWDASYTAFYQVTIPNSEQNGSSAWTDWINYRTFALKQLFDQLAEAAHNFDENAEVAVQFGSIWDAMSAARGTYDAAKLIENVDWVIVDDTPCYNHRFSMDLLRTIAKEKRISNEIDSPWKSVACSDEIGSTPEEVVLNQGLETYAYGGDMVRFANWDVRFPFCDEVPIDERYWCEIMVELGFEEGILLINQSIYDSVFSSLVEDSGSPVTTIEDTTVALYISTMMQYLYLPEGEPYGINTYQEIKDTYRMLTDGENKPTAIITDNVFTDDPSKLDQYTEGIYLPSFNRIISDSAFAALSQADVPLYAENDSVGTNNEYGEARIPTIFTPYQTTSTDPSEPSVVLPEKFELHQNYPNPFNPTTKITYSIPKRSNITLKVFDILGREVTTLVEGELNHGEHSLVFNAQDISSGIYFYQLKSDRYNRIRKMVIIQ